MMYPEALTTIFISLAGGVAPALFWLWFWLKEDRLHPEPKSKIASVFMLGMLSVFIVLPLEKFIFGYFDSQITILTLFLWATAEEAWKYIAAYIGALKSKDMDEPIDAVMYMITAALGFSALENTLFISNIIDQGLFHQSLTLGNSRFLGATLLHVASSAVIGVCIGTTYFKSARTKRIAVIIGLALAVILHTLFNVLIMELESDKFFVFSGVWVLIISIILLIEKVKQTHY